MGTQFADWFLVDFSEATYYNWKSKYGGLEASDLKRMYAEMAMVNDALKELIEKGSDANRAA